MSYAAAGNLAPKYRSRQTHAAEATLPPGVSHGGRQYSTLKTWGAGEQVAGKLQVELSYIRERERKGEYRELERGTKQSATTLKTY